MKTWQEFLKSQELNEGWFSKEPERKFGSDRPGQDNQKINNIINMVNNLSNSIDDQKFKEIASKHINHIINTIKQNGIGYAIQALEEFHKAVTKEEINYYLPYDFEKFEEKIKELQTILRSSQPQIPQSSKPSQNNQGEYNSDHWRGSK